MSAPLITLTTADNESFEVGREVTKQLITIDNYVQAYSEECSAAIPPFPIGEVTSATFKLVLEWCDHHKDEASALKEDKEVAKENGEEKEEEKKPVPEWDKEFLKKIDQVSLFHLAMAANYLDIKVLLDYCAKTIADSIRGKDAEGMRQYFGVKNDFTEEELEKIKHNNAWTPDDN